MMKQKVSWPVALLVVGVVVLLLAALYHRAAGGSEAQISPQFLQMSPAEQKAALLNAERARRRRGAPPAPLGP
jgi:hypothetical protein